mmetsp:Transcript_49510/g.129323  ORF Transcript_49510/g.129323 Transcript_49510/m.129323 type:complete len:257 (-) Transcript_49510:35-805(-)
MRGEAEGEAPTTLTRRRSARGATVCQSARPSCSSTSSSSSSSSSSADDDAGPVLLAAPFDAEAVKEALLPCFCPCGGGDVVDDVLSTFALPPFALPALLELPGASPSSRSNSSRSLVSSWTGAAASTPPPDCPLLRALAACSRATAAVGGTAGPAPLHDEAFAATDELELALFSSIMALCNSDVTVHAPADVPSPSPGLPMTGRTVMPVPRTSSKAPHWSAGAVVSVWISVGSREVCIRTLVPSFLLQSIAIQSLG